MRQPAAPRNWGIYLEYRRVHLRRNITFICFRNMVLSPNIHITDADPAKLHPSNALITSDEAHTKTIRLAYAPSREGVKTAKGNARFTARFIGAGGKVLAQVTGPTAEYKVRGTEGDIRASIHDSDGRRAWTQPVFLDGRK